MNSRRPRFLDKNVARFAVFKRKKHQLHRIFQYHHEPGHVGVCHGNELSLFDLLDKQRNNAAP